MKANTKAKWIVGITGTAFSAFMISQLDQPASTEQGANADLFVAGKGVLMSKREKDLAQLDWSDFSIQADNVQKKSANDRTTRRTR
ncbi:hypothetical protein [Pseudoneobacillus sp. C159]